MEGSEDEKKNERKDVGRTSETKHGRGWWRWLTAKDGTWTCGTTRACRMMSDYQVELVNDGMCEFYVLFQGPKDSLYEGGLWKVHVELPDAYPYKSPSIGFVNRIFHPNVDEGAGSVCLDVINQTWSPMFDLINVFEVFLPQLLLYPNPTDPLNGEAAAMLMRQPEQYKAKVKEYTQKYANPKDIGLKTEKEQSATSSDNESEDMDLSDSSENED